MMPPALGASLFGAAGFASVENRTIVIASLCQRVFLQGMTSHRPPASIAMLGHLRSRPAAYRLQTFQHRSPSVAKTDRGERQGPQYRIGGRTGPRHRPEGPGFRPLPVMISA